MRITMLAIVTLAFYGCGTDRVVKEYVPIPAGSGGTKIPPPIGGGGGGPSYGETQALLNTYCVSCHSTAQFMGSEKALRASATKDRVRSGNMPPSSATRELPDAERKAILTFF